MSYLWLLLLPLGPLLGAWLAMREERERGKRIGWLLSFAGAYLLGITLLNLIPEVFREFDSYKGLLVLAGFLFQLFMERYSEGIEHGHMHVHKHLRKHVIPLGIVASMSIHSFTEGIPLGSYWQEQNTGFYSLLFGIVLHEIPAAFALMSILVSLQVPRGRLQRIAGAYSLMALLGASLSIVMRNAIQEAYFDYFIAFVIGTFLHISTTILFENSDHHQFTRQKVTAVLLGIALAALVTIGH